jgi:branched-subunit amino acid transport protein AzlD
MMIYQRVCEIANTICIGHGIYTYTIYDYGHPERFVRPVPKSLSVAVFLTGVIATLGMYIYLLGCVGCSHVLVQGFFILRVYTLTKRLYISLIIAALIFFRLLGTSASSFISMRPEKMGPLISFEARWGWMLTVSWSISTVTDLSVTAILVVFLRKQRLGVCKRYRVYPP